MSGTSLDGIDATLVDLGAPSPALLDKYYLEFDTALKTALLELHTSAFNELHQAQVIGNQLARLYAQSVSALLDKAAMPANRIRAIGCHGQTIRHCPDQGYTLQIGNAALLAELSGITVVSDFRSRDVAAGGQGAPLVPAFHDKVLRHPSVHRAIVNIGGISNLTNLVPDQPTTGFDCGPGNLLMDAWNALHLGSPYDKDGAWAISGRVMPEFLVRLFDEPYFSMPPPKSGGRDLFNLPWLQSKLSGTERAEDVQATLLELTCQAIARSINNYCSGAHEIYLCGGGAHNRAIINRLANLLPQCKLATTEVLGVDSDYLEAMAFAWLAQQALHGKPANLPQVTGARHACILGAIYPNA